MNRKRAKSQRMLPRTKAMIAALVGISALFAAVPAAYAVTGDKSSGCTATVGCDLNVATNACPKYSTVWAGTTEELSYNMDMFYMVNAKCTVRLRDRMLSGSGYKTSAWRTFSNTSTKPKYGVASEVDARKRCFTEFAVKRKDGSWYSKYQYNSNYMSDSTFREKCSDS